MVNTSGKKLLLITSTLSYVLELCQITIFIDMFFVFSSLVFISYRQYPYHSQFFILFYGLLDDISYKSFRYTLLLARLVQVVVKGLHFYYLCNVVVKNLMAD